MFITNTSLLRKYIMICLAAQMTLVGCGQGGYQASSDGGSGANIACSSSENCVNNVPGGAQAPVGVDFSGQIADGTYKDVVAVGLDKENKTLKLTLPLPFGLNWNGTPAEVLVPKLKGAAIRTITLADGHPALELTVPLEHMVHGINFPPPQKLPNGDNLPGLPVGELPALAVSLSPDKKINSTIYFAKNMLGLYIEAPLNSPIGFSFPVRNKAKRVIGTFAMLSTKPGEKTSGFFIAAVLPNDVVRALDNML